MSFMQLYMARILRVFHDYNECKKNASDLSEVIQEKSAKWRSKDLGKILYLSSILEHMFNERKKIDQTMVKPWSMGRPSQGLEGLQLVAMEWYG